MIQRRLALLLRLLATLRRLPAMIVRPFAHLLRPLAVLLLVFGATAGCSDAEDASMEMVVRDSADVLIQEFSGALLERPAPLRLADAPEVRIGVVEGAAEYQWTRPVAATRLSDGGFAVLEQSPAEIRVFDRSGEFLHRIGTGGEGPGEFRSPVGLVALAGDTLLVWDRGAQRLSWFSPEGTLARERTLREPGGIRMVRRVALSPSGSVVVLGATTTEEDLGNQGRIRETWQVVRVEPNDTVLSLGAVPGTERAIQIQRSDAGEVQSVNVQGRWWWGEGFAWASERGAWTADQLAPEIRHFGLERGPDRIVRIAAEDRPFTGALIDSLHRVELERVADPAIQELWRADFEGREYPPAIPPIAGVFADAANRVWLGLLDPPPDPLPSGELRGIRRWVLFDEEPAGQDGELTPLQPLGVLTLPPRSHPLWADAEGVLLVRIDAQTDVAYVEWYRYSE